MGAERVSKDILTIAPCTEACPCQIDVPRYIRYIRKGKFDEALAVNREKIPFPSVCGYACFNPCEPRCGYLQFGEPIAIRALKRAAVENGGELWKKNLKVAPSSGKSVAVVGAGPAGLTAAYFLVTKGHEVTVYDAFPKPGGMMRYGIPRYRLPEESLDRDIDEILALGVRFEPNTAVGKDITLAKLKGKKDAMLLTTGANLSRRISVDGADRSGVLWGVDFLRDIAQGGQVIVQDPVVVVGGGNVAVDVALTARRLGAKDVAMVCLEKREEMPAHEWEIARSEEEGVVIHNSWGPKKFIGDGGASAVEFMKCTSVFDKRGSFSPTYDEGTTQSMDAKTVILAIGQASDLSYIAGESPISTDGGVIGVEEASLATAEAGVFAGGEVVSGPASIVEAVAQGRRAAISIDKYLGGDGAIDQVLATPEEEVVVEETGAETMPRYHMPLLSLQERLSGFSPVELGFSRHTAMAEAQRCLMCDARQFKVVVHTEGCKECGYCVEVCGLGVFSPADFFNAKGFKPMEPTHTEKCVGCLQCFYVCPDFSIDVEDAIKGKTTI